MTTAATPNIVRRCTDNSMKTVLKQSKSVTWVATLLTGTLTLPCGAGTPNSPQSINAPPKQLVAMRAEPQLSGRWRLIAVHHQPPSSSPFRIGASLTVLNEAEFTLNGTTGAIESLPNGYIRFVFGRGPQRTHLLKPSVLGDYLKLQSADSVSYFFEKRP